MAISEIKTKLEQKIRPICNDRKSLIKPFEEKFLLRSNNSVWGLDSSDWNQCDAYTGKVRLESTLGAWHSYKCNTNK